MSVKVKICGITNYQDAMMCCEMGADAVGFVFYPNSPRYIPFGIAEKIIAKLPPFVAKVGVFVNPKRTEIKHGIEAGITVLQLHGDEEPDDYEFLKGTPLIKVFRISGEPKESVLKRWRIANAFLFEGRSERGYGGVGAHINVNWLKRTVKNWNVIVAGGLTPANVRAVVKALKPYGVDVSSGVEKSPGIKDKKLVKEFIKNAKEL